MTANTLGMENVRRFKGFPQLGLAALVALTMFSARAASTGAVDIKVPLLTDRVFASTSFWYQPIPRDAPLHPTSAEFQASFLRQVKEYYGHVGINTANYASPVYVVDADVPTVRVTQWDCLKHGRLHQPLMEQWAQVPIPQYAQPAGGNDREMTVFQPSTDTIWEFWNTRKVNGEWQACWGGRMTGVSGSDGTWGRVYGATATGLPFLGGQITREELLRGEIRHVIGIALVNMDVSKRISWPAQRGDGRNQLKEPFPIPQGLRFRLDPAVDVDALKLHPVGKTIARAAQTYGFVVWDTAGSVSIRFQNPLTYTTRGEIGSYMPIFAGTQPYDVLKGFPWDRLQFLPLNYGKP